MNDEEVVRWKMGKEEEPRPTKARRRGEPPNRGRGQ